jgi:SAM-dependent methyltransferase
MSRAIYRQTYFYVEGKQPPAGAFSAEWCKEHEPYKPSGGITKYSMAREVELDTYRFNAFTAFLVDRLDFMVRLLYCKLGLFKLINRLVPRVYSSNFETLNEYFELMAGHLGRAGFSINGKSVLELGPGNSYMNAYNFLSKGARNVTLVDKYPRYCDTAAQRSYIQDEIDFFKKKRSADRFEYLDCRTCMPDQNYIRFIAGDLCEIDFSEKVDFIYSIAVLHHVRDLPRYVRKMSDMLNSGGMVFHAVDLKDKLHFSGSPFRFYRYSDFVWDRLMTEESVTYTNRLRYGEYVDLFAANGFEPVWESVIEYDLPPMKLAGRFAGRSDLHIGDAQFLFRKK